MFSAGDCGIVWLQAGCVRRKGNADGCREETLNMKVRNDSRCTGLFELEADQ